MATVNVTITQQIPLYIYLSYYEFTMKTKKKRNHAVCIMFKSSPEQPDLHFIKLGLVLISISHVFLIVLAINSPERLIQ